MTFLLVLPTILSLLVLCAHLLRDGGMLLIPLIALALPLLFVPRGWVARMFQFLLVGAAAEWVRTALVLTLERQDAGQPWLRMACILGGVTLFTLGAAALFETTALRETYPRRDAW